MVTLGSIGSVGSRKVLARLRILDDCSSCRIELADGIASAVASALDAARMVPQSTIPISIWVKPRACTSRLLVCEDLFLNKFLRK